MCGFWQGKRVLVTGHTGFVGAWLSAELSFLKADVTGFALKEECGSLYGKIKDKLKVRNVYGDLRDAESVKRIVGECNPEVIFHLAAFGFVKECYADPIRAYTTNVTGTLNILQAIRSLEHPCRIIVASSDKVYENNDKGMYLFRESDALGGDDPYSASKACEDILSREFYGSYLADGGHSMHVVRPSNILGGGDHNITRLIPSIYSNLGMGKSPEIRKPCSVRPWQNIFDINDAYLVLAEAQHEGCSVYNVGPEPDGIRSVGEIADYVSRLYGKDTVKNAEGVGFVPEKAYLGLSIEKIRVKLGWEPRRTLNQTLDEVYEFYQHDDGQNTYGICMKQIERYFTERGGL